MPRVGGKAAALSTPLTFRCRVGRDGSGIIGVQRADLAAGEGDTRTRWSIGQNFAARIFATDSDESDMPSLGTLGLNRVAHYTAPPQSITQRAIVQGCILTNFVDA